LRDSAQTMFQSLAAASDSQGRRSAAERFLKEFDPALTAAIAAGIAELYERRRVAVLQNRP